MHVMDLCQVCVQELQTTRSKMWNKTFLSLQIQQFGGKPNEGDEAYQIQGGSIPGRQQQWWQRRKGDSNPVSAARRDNGLNATPWKSKTLSFPTGVKCREGTRLLPHWMRVPLLVGQIKGLSTKNAWYSKQIRTRIQEAIGCCVLFVFLRSVSNTPGAKVPFLVTSLHSTTLQSDQKSTKRGKETAIWLWDPGNRQRIFIITKTAPQPQQILDSWNVKIFTTLIHALNVQNQVRFRQKTPLFGGSFCHLICIHKFPRPKTNKKNNNIDKNNRNVNWWWTVIGVAFQTPHHCPQGSVVPSSSEKEREILGGWGSSGSPHRIQVGGHTQNLMETGPAYPQSQFVLYLNSNPLPRPKPNFIPLPCQKQLIWWLRNTCMPSCSEVINLIYFRLQNVHCSTSVWFNLNMKIWNVLSLLFERIRDDVSSLNMSMLECWICKHLTWVERHCVNTSSFLSAMFVSTARIVCPPFTFNAWNDELFILANRHHQLVQIQKESVISSSWLLRTRTWQGWVGWVFSDSGMGETSERGVTRIIGGLLNPLTTSQWIQFFKVAAWKSHSCACGH